MSKNSKTGEKTTETIVVSLGGSTLYEGGKFDLPKAKSICATLNQAAKTHSLVVVVGGGPLARKRVDIIRAKGGSEYEADSEAIGATRENAKRIAGLLKNSFFVTDFGQAPALLNKGKTVVSGGMIPGITTDAVSVLFAELVHAKLLVNISNVDGVYTADPRKNKRAKLIRRMTHEKLVALAAKGDSRKARENFVFDLVAAKLAARSGITVHFVSSNELENAMNQEKTLKGTIVRK